MSEHELQILKGELVEADEDESSADDSTEDSYEAALEAIPGKRAHKELRRAVFETHVSNPRMPNDQIAKKFGINERTVRMYRSSDWWKRLYELYFKKRDEELRTKLVALDDEVVDNYGQIIGGKRPDDKTASAGANLIRARLEIGSSPLINRRPVNNTQVNTYNDNRQVSVQDVAEMKLSQEEYMHWLNTGEAPERIKKKRGQG